MGVNCIKGTGEAEATCAQLNEQGVCIYLLFVVTLVFSLYALYQ